MVITVTGSTGTIGAHLLRLLSDAGAAVRAVSRDARRVPTLPGVVPVQADLRDGRLLEPVVAGTDRLFLLSDNAPDFGRLQIEVLRAAQDLGIAHVVKLSALGASDHSKSWIGREHWQVEQELKRATVRWTLLRPHSFMQNWLDDVADSVATDGVIRSPIQDGRVPYIDTRDIAAVAAAVLLEPEPHAGRTYVLTGREAVGLADVAAALSEVTGSHVRYEPISFDEARARMQSRGVPQHAIDALLALAEYQRAGGPTARVSDDVERILGRPPRTIREFVEDHADRFRRPSRLAGSPSR